MSTVERTPSEAFTPEERATILAMLAATPTHRSSATGGLGPRAFSNAAYELGASYSDFTAAVDGPDGHIYDAIPDDHQFLDVPLDSPV